MKKLSVILLGLILLLSACKPTPTQGSESWGRVTKQVRAAIIQWQGFMKGPRIR